MKNWKYIDGAEGIKIGNKKVENTEVVKDGDVWVVLYAEGTKSKEFDSEQEAKKFAAQIGNGFSEKEKILLENKYLKIRTKIKIQFLTIYGQNCRNRIERHIHVVATT